MNTGKYLSKYSSPLGTLTLSSDGENITGLWIEGQKYFAASLSSDAVYRELPVFEEAFHWLDIYFAGENPDFMPKLATNGSAFQEAVWAILRRVPYGQVTTYGKIANQLENTRTNNSFAQAVGGAIARNPISILIPCHRVVGSNGSLTGYAGGIDRKIWLLQKEKIAMENLFIPKNK